MNMDFEHEINRDMAICHTDYYTAEQFNEKFNIHHNDKSSDINHSTPTEMSNNCNTSKHLYSLLHLNARSINKNFDSIDLLLSSINNFQFSVIGITETWLHKNSPPIFNINNYNILRDDRKRRRGGGVALYVNDSLTFKNRQDIHIEGTENIFIELTNNFSKNLIIGVIYKPPNSSVDAFLEKLEHILNTLAGENKPIYLMGDYNIDILPSQQNNNSLKLLNALSSYSLHPHINKATRISTNSETLIDNIFSNVSESEHFNGIIYSDVSDHLPIFVISQKIENNTKQHKCEYQRKETKHNIEKLNADLAAESWADVLREPDTDTAYELFINKLIYLYEKNIPLVRIKKNKRKLQRPWITKGIMRSIKTRNQLYKNALQTRSNVEQRKYKKYRNLLTTIIRLSRKIYYSTNIESSRSNTNSIWNIIKDLLGKKKATCSKIIDNGIEITDPNIIAESFNEYFTNIGPTLASSINTNDNFTQYLPQPSNNSLFFSPTSQHEIITIVKSLKASKSSGYDGLSVSLLKQIIHFIAPPLEYIFNNSLNSGRYPNSLKIAKVIPIYKKDDQTKIKNYRPISLLPGISKILEKIVYKRLFSFLNDNDILIPNQFGFRKNHSTDYAIIQLCDKIIEALTKKEHIIGVFMDLSKAFDTIDHKILTHKLKHYGVRGKALSWFIDYLYNREQYVNFHSCSSDRLKIKCGVPQGSILGPLLFLIYINDIINASPILTYILFADDTNIFYSHTDPQTLICTLNAELQKISSWFKSNKLSLNIDKTNFIYFKNVHSPDTECNLYIDGLSLVEKKSTKFLGVTIDSNLTWNEHIKNINTIISRNIGILYKLKDLLKEKSLFTLYNALVLPYITYCNIAWANSNKTKTETVHLLQKRALRICTHSHYLSSSEPLFKKLKTLKIHDIHTLQSAIFMYKYSTNILPSSFHNLYTANSSVHSYPTRHSKDYHLNNPKLIIAQKSIRHHAWARCLE